MAEEKRRSKRQSAGDEGFWECSMCTYRNPPEFFKCEICECRKGTSTRRPRVSSQLVAQQVAQSFLQPPPKKERREKKDKKERNEKVEVSPSVSSVEQDMAVDEEQETPEPTEVKPDVATCEDSVEGDREEPEIPESQPREYVSPPAAPKIKKEASTSKSESTPTTHSAKCATTKKSKSSRLKNIDRSSGQSMEVTVNNITVVITDYQRKKDRSTDSTATVSASSVSGSNLLNSGMQQALHERDGESKDSFSSAVTDSNVTSSGETENTPHSTATLATVES